jgi:type III secretion protein U
MSDDSSEAKTRPASQQKLRKQRREGQLPQTNKLVSLGTTAVGLGATLALLPGIVVTLTDFFDSTFRRMNMPLAQTRAPMLSDLALTLFNAVMPVIAAVVITAVALTVLYLKGIPFSATPLIPNFNKLNPAKGLTRMFGKRSWIESGIGLVQILLWVGMGGTILLGMLHPMLALHACGLACADTVVETLGRRLVYAAIVFCVVMMGLDMLVQRFLYAQDQRMTNTEYKREQKDQHGTREMRSERRRLRQEAQSESDALAEHAGIDRANMCFFTADNAVAIRYHPKQAPMPRVAAVGIGRDAAIALRKAVADNGFRETEDSVITDNCLRVRPGMGVPERIFQDLALGMGRIFHRSA